MKNKLIAAFLTVSVFSVNSYANDKNDNNNDQTTVTCKMVATQCENAIKLGTAATPYIAMGANLAKTSYDLGHAFIEKNIPNSVIGLAKPYASEESARRYGAHAIMAASGYLTAVIAMNTFRTFASIPYAILTTPFRNRITMFIAGIAAKTIYDSYHAAKTPGQDSSTS